MTNELVFTWLDDSYDCETCGGSWATGAIVTLNEETIFELIPLAHCYDGKSIERDQVYEEVFKKLGYDVKEEYQ